MKTRWLAAIPVALTFLLVFIIFVPIVQSQAGGIFTECEPRRCVTVVQYESISYAFGGWGAVFQTGVDWYHVGGWACSCPMNATACCVPPFAGIIRDVIGFLAVTDLASMIINRGLTVRKVAG
jgi:hypothetical protein